MPETADQDRVETLEAAVLNLATALAALVDIAEANGLHSPARTLDFDNLRGIVAAASDWVVDSKD